MNHDEFCQWLSEKVTPEALFPIRRVKSSLNTIEKKLKVDLNDEYTKDKGEALLSQFKYSLKDEADNLSTPPKIAALLSDNPLNEINQFRQSLQLYFEFLQESENNKNNNPKPLSNNEIISLKKIYDAIICYLHKCESLPLESTSNMNDYYGLYLSKRRDLSDSYSTDIEECSNLAATQIMIDAGTDRHAIGLVFDQEGLFLRNTQIYQALYKFLNYDLRYILRATDFYDPNEFEDDDFEEGDVATENSTTDDEDAPPPKKEIGLLAAISIVCSDSYVPQKDAENLYARIIYKSARRTVATERLFYLLNPYLN